MLTENNIIKKPMTFDEFMALSDKEQRAYLEFVVFNFGVTKKQLAEMMKTSESSLTKVLKKYGMQAKKGLHKYDEIKWLSFCYGTSESPAPSKGKRIVFCSDDDKPVAKKSAPQNEPAAVPPVPAAPEKVKSKPAVKTAPEPAKETEPVPVPETLAADKTEQDPVLDHEALKKYSWDAYAQAHSFGDIVTAEITAITDYGAFAKLTPFVYGLIHISELADKFLSSPEDVVKVGDIVKVKILRLDKKLRKISLSLKRVPKVPSVYATPVTYAERSDARIEEVTVEKLPVMEEPAVEEPLQTETAAEELDSAPADTEELGSAPAAVEAETAVPEEEAEPETENVQIAQTPEIQKEPAPERKTVQTVSLPKLRDTAQMTIPEAPAATFQKSDYTELFRTLLANAKHGKVTIEIDL